MMRSRPFRLLVGFVFAVAFSYLAFEDLNWTALRDAFGSVGPAALAAALALLGASFGVRILRWGYMLRAVGTDGPLSRCAWPFVAGFAVNNTLPLRAGDVLRAVGFQDELQSSSSQVSSTLVVERLLDLLTLLALFFVGLLGVDSGVLPSAFVWTCTSGGTVGIALLGGLLFLPGHAKRVCHWCLQRPSVKDRGWSQAACKWLDDFWQSFAALRSPALTIKLVTLSLLAWIFEGGMFAIVTGTMGLASGSLAPWFSLSTGTLATLLPSTPGHAGTFDYFAKLGLTAYGTPEAMTAAFVLIVHLLLWLPITILGWGYLAASKRNVSELNTKDSLEQA